MTSRITFLVITLFWLTMTYLLWRSEYIGHNELGSSVPVELVWRKILTAPDSSRLEITHNGKRVGDCQWMANIGQDAAAGRILTDDSPPEESAPGSLSYRLNFVGNVALNDFGKRLRFDLDVPLATNQMWQGFDLRLNLRPTVWEVHSVASDQKVKIVIDDRYQGRTERTFKFTDLQNPQALLQDFDLPAPLGMLGVFNPFPHALSATNAPALALPTLKWQARNDWITIAHTSVRAYQVEATVLDRYRMRLTVSSVGEILRVELPDGWELVNDQLLSL